MFDKQKLSNFLNKYFDWTEDCNQECYNAIYGSMINRSKSPMNIFLKLCENKEDIDYIKSNQSLYNTLIDCIHRVRNDSRGSRIVTDIIVCKKNIEMTKLDSEGKFLGANIHYIDNNHIDSDQIVVCCKSKIPIVSYKDLIFICKFDTQTV
jgi:hypothetical protein